jgi:hypothetical protein
VIVPIAIRRWLCVLLVIPSTLRAAPAADAPGGSGAEPPRTAIDVVDVVFTGPRLSPRLEGTAMKEVTRIWATYGVDVALLKARGRGRDGAVTLTVKIASGLDERMVSGTLGLIRFRDGVPDSEIVMYPDAVAALVATAQFGTDHISSLSAFRDLILGRVLGRALAHEIGHFLLRSRIHSAAGLMRALQPVTALVAPDRRDFGLSPDEVIRLRHAS